MKMHAILFFEILACDGHLICACMQVFMVSKLHPLVVDNALEQQQMPAMHSSWFCFVSPTFSLWRLHQVRLLPPPLPPPVMCKLVGFPVCHPWKIAVQQQLDERHSLCARASLSPLLSPAPPPAVTQRCDDMAAAGYQYLSVQVSCKSA